MLVKGNNRQPGGGAYLASKLGSHDGLVVGRVPSLHVGDHSLSGDIVVVNAMEIRLNSSSVY